MVEKSKGTKPKDHQAMADQGEDQLSYEQAREELIAVVQRLESGGAPLEESLALWERGELLAALCQRRLDGARATVEAARNQSAHDDDSARDDDDAE